VTAVLPLVMFVLAGLLFGGIYSLRKQGAGRGVQVIFGLLGTLALAAGVLWMWPE
jgi:hypothetical protein